MAALVIFSHYQALPLLSARKAGQTAGEVSPDLGLSIITASLTSQGVRFPDEILLLWEAIEEIAAAENNCFAVTPDGIEKIVRFSELTGRVYSLMPTTGAPTMLISGIPMHRIKDTEPHADTLEKIKAARPLTGHVLDTATGLGYTAIEASQTARQVTTIELDPVALEIARFNPWSRRLFANPKIEQHIGDSYDVLETFPEGAFDSVIHDPPAFALAGDLYSGEYYHKLFRVLRCHGHLFHYIGNPESKSGHNITRSVIHRLKAAGFRQVRPAQRAFGVVAVK